MSAKARWRTAVMAAAVALLPGAAFAQASIAGVVKDASGAVLPGVTVEAASPALIEKARTVVSDSSGQYRIVDLRPGTYTVTFTLAGFNTYKRDGIELTGNFTATVDADLRVGALEETITVTGETPIVDVSSATRQRVLRQELLDALPNDRVPAFMAALSPGINISTQDVGGSMGNTASGSNMTSHGSRTTDIRTLASGVSVQSLETGSSAQGVPNLMMYQEVTVDSSGASAENDLGGVTINLIPREGGNTYHGSFVSAFANESMQGDNFTQELQDRGLGTPNRVKTIWDVNPGFGGPIRRDKVWFFATGRYTGANNFVGGMFFNANASNPAVYTYVPDTSRPAFIENVWKTFDTRITWQADERNKIAFGFDQTEANNPAGISATTAPESADPGHFRHDRAFRGEWTAPMTNRLLAEAVLYRRTLPSFDTHPDFPSLGLSAITDQGTGVTFRALTGTKSFKINSNIAYRAALSYVTGTHAFKFGFSDGQGTRKETLIALDSPIAIRVNNGIANQLTQVISPDIRCNNEDGCDEYQNYSRQNHDLGVFAQDKWAIDRLTLSYGIRFSRYKSSFPAQHVSPGTFAPNLNLDIPKTPGVDWKDVAPRLGVVYDAFGTGRTAVKVSLNKFVNGQALTGNAGGGTTVFGSSLNPFNRLVLSTTRNWADANRDFVPDCDLTNPAANGECAAMTNQNFGRTVPGTAYDPEVLNGWGKRGYNWEFAAGVQHEILPRTSLEVTYFRRWFGNFIATDNRAVAASDYTQYQITAPSDSRLPNGGGYAVTGLYDLNPNKVGQVDNYITFADNFGDQFEHWNGIDVTANSRFAGIQFMGGLSTGRQSADFCGVVEKLPEMLFGLRTLARTNAASVLVPQQYCAMEEGFLTQVKFVGSYTIPKIDVQFGGSYQNIPGTQLAANFVANNGVVQPSLGRVLSGGANNVTVSILEPGKIYGERVNQLDLRFAKILNLGGVRRATVSLDLANAFNANTVLTESVVYTTWRQPQSILTARFVKVGLQFNF
jgi:carboxypeptidase family protein